MFLRLASSKAQMQDLLQIAQKATGFFSGQKMAFRQKPLVERRKKWYI